jgi:hypothetical protein
MAVSPTRKVCPVCGQEKSIRHSFYRWRDSRTGHMRTARLCKVCSRARAQERNARVMADAYTADLERKRRTAYRRTHPRPDDAAKSRSYRERLKETNPEVYEQQIADARIRKGQRRDTIFEGWPNWLIQHVGIVSVGFGLMAAGRRVYAAGFALTLPRHRAGARSDAPQC